MIQTGDWARLGWGPNCLGQPHCTYTFSSITLFQLRSGSLGLLWAACPWIIAQIFWAYLGHNSWPCLCLMMVGQSVGPIAVTTPLGCCGTASPALCPSSAPGWHDPWKLTPFFMPPLLKPHQSTASAHVQEPHFSLLDCWWDLLLSKLFLCSPFLRHVGTVAHLWGHCCVCGVVILSSPSLVKQPRDCSSLTACGDCRRKRSLQGMAGKEREMGELWGRWHSPAATTNSHISDSWSQRRSQQMCRFSSTSAEAVILPTLWS